MKKCLFTLVALALLLTPVLAACGAEPAAPATATTAPKTGAAAPTTAAAPKPTVSTEPVKIGTVNPFTGPAAASGQFATDWTKVVEQQVKDTGGILGGRPVQFAKYDDASSSEGVVAGVTKMVVDENVSAIGFAGFSSASQLVASETVEKLKVLFVTGGIYDLAKFKYTIGSTFPYQKRDGLLTDFIIKSLKSKTAMFLLNQSEENEKVRIPAMRATLDAAGIKTLDVIAAPLATTDWSSYITKIKFANPDVLVVNIDSAPANFVKQLPDLGGLGNTKILGMSTQFTTLSTTQFPYMEGWYASATYVPGMTDPASKTMEAAWAKVNGTKPIVTASVIFYINYWLAIKAVDLAGSTDREAVNNAAHSGKLTMDVPYDPYIGKLMIQPDGRDAQGRGAILQFAAGGKLDIVPMPK